MNLLVLTKDLTKPLVLSHRGSSITYPENTLLAFRKSLEQGAVGIELDVHLCADGIPVVIHDSSLKRLSGNNKDVSRLSLTELKRIRFTFDQRIPTLEEVLRTFYGKCQLLIEFKSTEAVAASLELIENFGSYGINFCSFSPQAIVACKQLQPDIPAFLNTGALTVKPKGLWREHFPEKTARTCNADGISCYHRFVNHRQVAAAKEISGPLMTWCGLFDERNDVEWIKRVLDFYPKVIISARPSETIALLDTYYPETTDLYASQHKIAL